MSTAARLELFVPMILLCTSRAVRSPRNTLAATRATDGMSTSYAGALVHPAANPLIGFCAGHTHFSSVLDCSLYPSLMMCIPQGNDRVFYLNNARLSPDPSDPMVCEYSGHATYGTFV